MTETSSAAMVADSPGNPACRLCIATIGGRASLALAAERQRFAVEIFSSPTASDACPRGLAARRKAVLLRFREGVDQ